MRICLELGEPSAEIVRVETPSLWRRANFLGLSGDRVSSTQAEREEHCSEELKVVSV